MKHKTLVFGQEDSRSAIVKKAVTDNNHLSGNVFIDGFRFTSCASLWWMLQAESEWDVFKVGITVRNTQGPCDAVAMAFRGLCYWWIAGGLHFHTVFVCLQCILFLCTCNRYAISWPWMESIKCYRVKDWNLPKTYLILSRESDKHSDLHYWAAERRTEEDFGNA